jgi:hypothetical protein
MAAPELNSLWLKSDEHGKEISKLHTLSSVNKALLEQLAQEFRTATADQNRATATLQKSLDSYGGRVDAVLESHYEQKGAARMIKIGLGIFISAGCLWVAVSNMS